MNTKRDFLNTDRIQKDGQTEELRSANRRLVYAMRRQGRSSSLGRGLSEDRLIDMKGMIPKIFDGKLGTPYRAWVKAVRAYCEASQPGMRKYLWWLEVQTSPIDADLLSGFQWEHKEAASHTIYDFLFLHITDDAQQLVELQQDENGPEAWRQLPIRFDPIGESYVFDQMAALMEVPRCKHLTDLPGVLTKWERSLRNFTEGTGGQAGPPEWNCPSCSR